jgi:hypothetical protein
LARFLSCWSMVLYSRPKLGRVKLYILDPVLIEPSRIVISAHRTVTLAKERDKVSLATSLDPAIIVLLDSSSTPPSLITVSRLTTLVDDTVLVLLAILCIPNGCNNGGKFSATLRADIHIDRILIQSSVSLAVLSLDGRVPIGKDRGTQEECKDKLHRQSSQSM